MTLSSNITWLHLHELFHAFLFWNNVCSEHSSIKWWVDRVTTLQRHLTRSKMNIQAEPCQLKRSLAADLLVVRHSFWVGSQTRQQTNMQKWSQRKLQVEQQYLWTSWLEKTANKLRWFPLEYIANYYIPRLSLNWTGTAIGWLLVTWPWLKSNVSQLWYIKQCTPLGIH